MGKEREKQIGEDDISTGYAVAVFIVTFMVGLCFGVFLGSISG